MKKYVVIYQSDLNFGLFANKVFDTLEDVQRCIRIELCKLILEEEKAFQDKNMSLFNEEDNIIDILSSILNDNKLFNDYFLSYDNMGCLRSGWKNDITYKIVSLHKIDI